MQDAIFIAVGIGFIALSVAYVRGLDALVGPDPTSHQEVEGAKS